MSRAFGNRMLKPFVVAEPEIQVNSTKIRNQAIKCKSHVSHKVQLSPFSIILAAVGGVLAMSRAFGNRMLKPFVVAEPEIQDQEIDEDLELLVLASDGLWDVVPNEDAVSLARTEEEPEAAARKLTETAFTRGSADNITCIVVRFHHNRANGASPQPG
ncbi:hypothetical protein SLEP1_g3325 [Rubroshorea leprosula]|uniref:PPM-type phosphatase domain-containing protein n=1 Tax=Rubroshorea leprosula TaxID=152421 RepID=A0AAV5HTS3_9ROSI|nr:hypothetical protein SLEP1_g3325 [Rubroshorea leprosula]